MPSSSEEQLRLRQSLFVYRLAAPFVAALLVPGFLRRMLRRGGYKDHFTQRLGRFHAGEVSRLKEHRWTWIRSISVGETLVALKLARALRALDPEIKVAISVTTSTGYALAAKEETDWLFVFYNPVDTLSAVNGTLSVLRPERLVLVEGEIWPNLMVECERLGIPVMLANARLSKKSARGFARFQRWTSPFFKLLKWVAIPDEEDRARWDSIGMPSDRIVLTGSIKFDQEAEVLSKAEVYRELLRGAGVQEGTPIFLAGSTHDGEEEILFQCFAKWRQTHPTLRLIIAPRHVERVPELVGALAPHAFKVELRTSLPSSSDWDVLFLNTTGELRDWYPLANVVFVGKSITAEGGQNPVEPALAGRAVLFGPHMENFESVVKLLLDARGAIQVSSVAELTSVTDQLLCNPQEGGEMGESAKKALAVHQGSARRTAQMVWETFLGRC